MDSGDTWDFGEDYFLPIIQDSSGALNQNRAKCEVWLFKLTIEETISDLKKNLDGFGEAFKALINS